jgi:hypothetical protein
MIRHAKPGTRVRLHYAKKRAVLSPLHGATGVVLAAGRGPGPRNVIVAVDNAGTVVVPAGNMERVK